MYLHISSSSSSSFVLYISYVHTIPTSVQCLPLRHPQSTAALTAHSSRLRALRPSFPRQPSSMNIRFPSSKYILWTDRLYPRDCKPQPHFTTEARTNFPSGFRLSGVHTRPSSLSGSFYEAIPRQEHKNARGKKN